MFKHSISYRLAIMFVITFVLLVSIYGLFLRSSLHDSLAEQMHNELTFRANLIEPWITSRTDSSSWQALTSKLSDLALTEGGRVSYWIFNTNNHSLLGNAFLPNVNISDLKPGFARILSNEEDACAYYLYIVDLPVQEGKEALRYVISLDSTAYMGTFDEFTRNLVLITILGLGLIALMSFAIVRIGMKPVKTLSDQAQNLAPGEQGMRLDAVSLPIELKELAVSFNGVLNRQEIAWQQLDSFNSDVAHELKTPLTNLIGQTQFALTCRHSINDMQDVLGSNLEELERMTAIVNDMLFLSHAYAGESASNLKKVSLRTEAGKTMDYVEPLFAENNIRVELIGDVTACIDHRLFHRALANLLTNSARYAEPNTQVNVSIEQKGDLVNISVANQGEAIEDNHLSRLFERFYRMDSSRTNSRAHHGLGLSIVKAVALMHGGNVFACSSDGVNTFGFSMKINPDMQANDEGDVSLLTEGNLTQQYT